MKTQSLKVSVQEGKSGQKAKVRLHGELSVQNMVDLKDQLIHLLETYKELDIVVEKVDNFDISCIQIFYALSRSASHLDKRVTYHINLPKEISSVIEHSGFHNLLVPKAELQ